MVVSGGSASIVNARVAGERSGRPDVSSARTASVYEPLFSCGAVNGDEQAANAGTGVPGPSMRHSKVAPVALEPNVNDGVGSLVAPSGPAEMNVSAAPVSMANARVAGEGSGLPAASIARTRN